jgi:midasin (ATPase involved in ribosome maturation)
MGSDLPMPENNEETDLNGIGGGSFKWCDGALLKAIKNGDWVLLDELNLASQSVLEGLNSCLDHRASVYIPELGQTFVCPPTFRIFAAQNPIAQGGGRKGLPKSFLNRFTKVYVEALSKNDLNDIVTAKFPKLPSDLVEKIILFNYSVQDDIEHGKYGQIGSPWEFNLRDVFRLCELIIHHYELSGKIECAKFSSVVYLQRFRSSSDRAMLAKCYETHFDDAVSDRDGIHVELKDHSVKIGVATLRRNLSCSPESSAYLLGREPISLRHLTSALEAVALCVEMCWPCLLVGSPSCGKSSVLKYLAESCNRQMVEIALTPSSDVNELIGSFEQIDATEVESRVIHYLKDIFNYACLILNCNKVQTEILREMSSIYHDLMTDIQKVKKMTTSPLVINDAHIITRIGEFVSSAEKAEAASSVFKNSCDVMLSSVKRDILSFKSSKKAAHGMNTTYFRWYDGILVEALEKGYWLHLENVNFCPSSVLDRLNSLMEFGGNLVLTECGISDDREDGNGTPRIVKPHPDFRLFLSMNPAFGEISRAMRNRCVEVCILAPSVTNIGELIPNQEVENSRATSAETLDALDCLWNAGFRSSALSISVIKMHRKEFLYDDSAVGESQPTRTLGDLASLLMASLQRGRHTSNCFTCQQKVAYEIHDEEFTERDIYCFAVDNKQFQMVENLSFRRVLGQPLDMRKISEDARLLRSIHDDFNFLPLGVSKFNRLFQGNEVKSAFESFAHSLVRNDPRLPNVKSFLTARFINRLCPSDAYNRVSYFEGFSLGVKALSLVATILVTRKRIISDPDLFKAAYIDRLAQIIDEQETYNDMAKSGGSDRLLSDLSAIELSYCIQCNEVDSSQISCPVTPMLYPLFLTLDRYLESVADTLSCGKPSGPLIGDVVSLFTARDRLWKFLKGSPTVLNSPFLSFDETGFLVHWSWLNKRLSTMLSKAMSLNSAQGDSIIRNMCLIVEAIDQAVQCKSSDFRLSNSFWKKAGHPLVPAKAEDSFSLFHLKNVASKFSLLNNEDFGYLRIVSRISSGLTLDQLIHRYHNIFSFDNDQKRDLLNALCMAQWATTDEMSAKTRIETKDYDAAKALKVISSKLYSAAEDFQLKLHSCTIDAEIKTFENELHVDGLTRFQQTCVDDSSSCIIHHSLYAFGKIQLTQLSEFLCMKDEEWIVDTLSNILLDNDDSTALTNLRDIVLPRIKTFISTVISYTIWPMSDLRAYQSLVWAIESATSIRYLFKCCHSTLICTLQRHYWCNSFNDLNVISNVLAFQPFWTKLNDGENSNHYISDKGAVIPGIVGLSGVPRMKQNVVTEYFFRLQGFKRISDSASRSVPFLTLENHVVRRKQSQDIVRLIASNNNSISGKASGLQTLKLLTENTIAGLQDFFESEDLFSNLYKACFNEPIDVLPIVKQCKHQTFQKLVPTVLVPLINVCRRLWPTNSSEDVGFDLSLAEVYLGILRFHLFIPSSPLDPGKKPGAKVEQWNRYIKELGSKLLAIRMESGLTTGNFEPDTADVQDTLSTLNYCQRKRSIQERKRVERPSNLPSFFELFQDVKHFADTIASVDNILLLLEDICMYQESESNVSCSDKEVTWQSSAVAFFNRISSKYACYEDVTEPFLAALGMIQKGLRSLLNEKTTKHRSPTSTLMHVEDKLLKYPNVEASLTCDPQILNHLRIAFDNATNSVQESSDLIKIGKNTHVTILLSNLANTCILRERKIIANVQFMRMISQIFEAFADAWNSDSSVVNNGPDPDSSKVEISDQFPDHAVEFQRIFEDVEATENQQSAWLNMLKSEPEDNSDFSITEDHIMFMCDIHREIFSQERNGLNDGLRIKAFVSTYTAAAQLNNILLREFSIGSEAERLSAHCYALGINANTDSGHTINFHSYTRPSLLNEVDFHKDPNSAEVAKAGIPLENLSIRVSQLIRAFPGNSLLVSIGLVVERMRRLDLKKTSLGKMLTGLEVILRKAQDWEQHASKRVSFGESLENISHLVARWRKLELQSWSTLLNVRDQKHVLQAKKHWIRLYNVLLSDTVNSSMKDHVATKVCFPSWILVGQSKKLKNLFTCNIERECKESTQQILKLLDTFILTSGIGQFNERLKIIKTFSEHVRAECDVNIERNIHKLTKAIVLESFVGYYTQFSSVIEKVKVELRKPLENKLKDEVKLAKWDEQSYYALAESAEKSHRKLMMIVHDYEEILDTPVLKILEDHFISGIRVNSEVGPMTSQPTTGIPPNMSMFLDIIPDNEECSSGLVLDHNLTSLRAQNRNWVATLSYFDESKYVLGIPKYAKKMEKLFSSTVTSSASLGSNMAADICNSVFERIDILREKGTKSMKERALVDLFKALKQQGYSSMKWNVPKEIQEMQEIFRIQNPSLEYLQEHHHKTLKNAETYFHRCTLELSRLRSEVQMMGSPYMSKREMDIMVGFSENGLLMLCQQRAIITKAIDDVRNILQLLTVFDVLQEALPHDQTNLVHSIKNFDRRYSITLETIRQTFLMMKTVSTLVEDNRDHSMDLVSIVDSCFTSLNDAYNPYLHKTLITKHTLISVSKAKDAIRSNIENFKSCRIRNEQAMCFPQHIFDPCLDMLHRCLHEVQKCEQSQTCLEQKQSLPFELSAFTKKISDLVASSLVAAQTLHDGSIGFSAETDDDELTAPHTLWDIHTKTLMEWDTLNIGGFSSLLEDLIDGLTRETNINGFCLGSICADACVLVLKVVDKCQQRLCHTLNFYRNTAKFEYIKLRLFRVLVAKGYCADEVEESGDCNGGGGEGNMKFEDDVEGTGMGEGEGKNDVTDQIENEEQLLGLKGDEKNENKKEQKQLDENEAETGMEMENEFEGEMFDVPDKKDTDDANNEEEEEELDREMGDGRDPNEQVVDEKMWDDEDEDGDPNGEEEKFEKDSKVSGEALKDEMRTKEDDEKDCKDEGNDTLDGDKSQDNNEDEESPKGQDNHDGVENDGDERLDDDPINNDYEDNYEDKHQGIDVNNDDQEQNNMDGDEEDIDLKEDMDLDNGENADEPGDKQDGSQLHEGQETEEPDEDGDVNNTEEDVMDVDNDEEAAEQSDGNEDNVENSHQTRGDDNQMNADGEDNDNDNMEEDKPQEEENVWNSSKERHQDAHGVAASNGPDSVQQQQDEISEEGEGNDNDEDQQHQGEGQVDDKINNSGGGQSGTSSGDIQKGDQGTGNESNSASMDIPNPFRDPGDAERFWH